MEKADAATASPKRFQRSVVVAVAGAALAAALVLLYRVNPAEGGVYPVCLFHYLTGLHCPGCGTLRALHQLVHAQLSAALAMNPLAVCMLPILVVAGVWQYALKRVRPASSPLPRRRLLPFNWIWLLLIAIVAFGILRNIPVYPFTLLAPH